MELRVRFTFLHYASPLPNPRSKSCPPLGDPPSQFDRVCCKWTRLAFALLKRNKVLHESLFQLTKFYDFRAKRVVMFVSRHVHEQLLFHIRRHVVASDAILLDRIFVCVADAFAIKCSDAALAHPLIAWVICWAYRLNRNAGRNCFTVLSHNKTFVVKFSGGCSILQLRVCLQEQVRIPPRQQILTHLGRKLVHGPLASYGVRPGSFVYVLR